MMFRNLLALLILFSFVIFLTGCKSGGTQPSNPFAQNLTVPPPATFSSQESYLGQTPGGFVPQPQVSPFPQSGSVSPAQPATTAPPADMPFSNVTNNNVGDGATLFAATGGEPVWTPVEVATTSQTAFQALDAKVNLSTSTAGFQAGTPESLIVGASHVVTTIVDESQPAAPLTEPPVLLYAGQYAE